MPARSPKFVWHRADEQSPPQLELAADLQVRDAATARALQAYLQSRPRTPVRTTVEIGL